MLFFFIRTVSWQTWDAELEMMAQRWASQCNYGYSQCRYTGMIYKNCNNKKLISHNVQCKILLADG